MVLNSYSKINLSLLVTSKDKNKFHNIQSYFCLISLKDKIKIKKINKKKDIINFNGAFSKLISKKNNSIKTLLITLRKLNLTSSYYSISIEKKNTMLESIIFFPFLIALITGIYFKNIFFLQSFYS